VVVERRRLEEAEQEDGVREQLRTGIPEESGSTDGSVVKHCESNVTRHATSSEQVRRRAGRREAVVRGQTARRRGRRRRRPRGALAARGARDGPATAARPGGGEARVFRRARRFRNCRRQRRAAPPRARDGEWEESRRGGLPAGGQHRLCAGDLRTGRDGLLRPPGQGTRDSYNRRSSTSSDGACF